MANLRKSGVFNLGSLSSDNAFEAPSLDLNFDGQLSSYTRATTSPTAPKANGDQLATDIISCTRSTTATFLGSNGLIQTAAVNTPRVEFDASGNPLGLLVEESRTNLMHSTNNVAGTGAGYTLSNPGFTATDNYGTAPDGTASETTRLEYAGGVFKQVRLDLSGINLTSGDVYTASLYFKATPGSSSPNAFRLNIQEGSGGAQTTSTNQNATSEWQRATVTHTVSATNTSGELWFRIQQATNSEPTDIEVWGAQLEKGEGATSYIPNTATSGTVTRTADDITLSTSNFGFDINNSTVLVDATLQSETATGSYPRIWELSGSSTQRLFYRVFGGNTQLVFDDSGNDTLTIDAISSYPYAAKFASAHVFSGGSTVASTALNGVVTSQSVTSTGTGSYTQLSLGGPTSATTNYQTTNRSNGHIRRFTYFPRAISDVSLASYTGTNPPTQELIRPTRKWGGMLGRTLTTDVVKAPVVDHSLRFDGSGDYLNRVVTASDRTTWTWSAWVKKNDLGTRDYLFSGGAAGVASDLFYLQWEDNTNAPTRNNQLYVIWREASDYAISAATRNLETSASYNDTSAWYHVVLSVDTTKSNSSDRMKIYIDGAEVSYANDNRNSIVSSGLSVNAAGNLCLSAYAYNLTSTTSRFKGQMAEVHFVDGQALTAADFGETNASGQWVPKEVTGVTYGTNGFYLPFDRKPEGVTLLLDGSSTTNDVANSQTFETVTNVTAQSAGVANSNGPVLDFGSGGTTPTTGHLLDSNPTSLPEGTEDFTVEFWFRRDYVDNSAARTLFAGINGIADRQPDIFLDTNNKVNYYHTSSTKITGATTIVYQKWFHIAAVRNAGTTTLFVDGVSQGSFLDTGSYTTGTKLALGGYYDGTSWVTGTNSLQGQMTDVRVTRGIARDIAADWTAGVYNSPLTNDIQYGSLGRDASTNGNNFTVPANTITPDDQLIDSPNLRFATFDPAFSTSVARTLSEGNLWLTSNLSNFSPTASTQPVSSGKHYAEFLAGDSDLRNAFGVCEGNYNFGSTDRSYTGSVNNVGMFAVDGKIYSDGAQKAAPSFSGATHNSTVFGIALDLDSATKTVKWYLDGTLHYTYTLTSLSSMRFCVGDVSGSYTSISKANFGQDHTFSGTLAPLTSPYSDDDGNGEFYYQPPLGFKALTTKIVGSDTALQSTGVISLAEHYQTKLPR